MADEVSAVLVRHHQHGFRDVLQLTAVDPDTGAETGPYDLTGKILTGSLTRADRGAGAESFAESSVFAGTAAPESTSTGAILSDDNAWLELPLESSATWDPDPAVGEAGNGIGLYGTASEGQLQWYVDAATVAGLVPETIIHFNFAVREANNLVLLSGTLDYTVKSA